MEFIKPSLSSLDFQFVALASWRLGALAAKPMGMNPHAVTQSNKRADPVSGDVIDGSPDATTSRGVEHGESMAHCDVRKHPVQLAGDPAAVLVIRLASGHFYTPQLAV